MLFFVKRHKDLNNKIHSLEIKTRLVVTKKLWLSVKKNVAFCKTRVWIKKGNNSLRFTEILLSLHH